MREDLHMSKKSSTFALAKVLEGKSDGKTGGDSGSGGVYEGVVTRLLCAVLECDCGVVDGA